MFCSLPCVKQHKQKHGCDGKRHKTAFVHLSQFDDNQLLRDYYFLEDVGRFVDSTHRDRICHGRQPGNQSRLQWVRSMAERRGTTVLLQPPGMSLHAINTSTTVWRRHSKCSYVLLDCSLNYGRTSFVIECLCLQASLDHPLACPPCVPTEWCRVPGRQVMWFLYWSAVDASRPCC